MTTPPRPDEPRRPRPVPLDARRRADALWALVLRRFRDHLERKDSRGRTE